MTMIAIAAASRYRPGLFIAKPAAQHLFNGLYCRSFAKQASPGSDPLQVLRKESLQRNLCDEHGYRRPGVHWVFSIAVSPEDINKPPNLRTVGLQRVSNAGIDFVMKRGPGTEQDLCAGRPMSLLYLQGKYVMGEKAHQWRAEGHCEKMMLSEILHRVPHYTISAMVASKRIENEDPEHLGELTDRVSKDRHIMERKSHFTEVTQKVRIELENGDISNEEMDESIRALRFLPDRMELMSGGPDAVLWERWEWLRADSGVDWNEPNQLLPH